MILLQGAEVSFPEQVMFKVNCKGWVGIREVCENIWVFKSVCGGGGQEKLEGNVLQRGKLSKGLDIDLKSWMNVRLAGFS